MNPITLAVLKAGLISPAMLKEMKRISPLIAPDAEVGEPVDLDLAVRFVEDALQSDEYVLVRETDLESVRQYVETTRTLTLHIEDGPESSGDIEVTVGVTPLGEYIVAWKGESIRTMMTNGMTYLVDGNVRVFFRDVRELFFGEYKAFMVCTPSVREPHVQS